MFSEFFNKQFQVVAVLFMNNILTLNNEFVEKDQFINKNVSTGYLRLTSQLLDPNEKDLAKAREIFDQALDDLPNAQERRKSLCEALNCLNWGEKVFQQKDYPLYGLLAVKDDYLTPEQYAFMMFYWAIKKDLPDEVPQFIPLFTKEGENNPEAEEIIDATVEGIPENNASGLTKEKKKQIFQGMKKAPLSDQQFFVIEDNEDDNCITKRIQQLGVNIFRYYTTKKGEKMRMVPSLSLVSEFLKTFGKSAIRVTPVINLSPLKFLKENGRTATRDIFISFPNEEVPQQTDTWPVSIRYNISDHDFCYHAILAALIPDDYRQLYIDISDEIETITYVDAVSEIFAKQASEMFVDMEGVDYRPEKRGNLTIPQLFWAHVERVLGFAQTRLSYAGYSEIRLEEMFESFLPSFYELLIGMEERLKNDYGIEWSEVDNVISIIEEKTRSKKGPYHFIIQVPIREATYLRRIKTFHQKILSEKSLLLNLYKTLKEENWNEETDLAEKYTKLTNDKATCLQALKKDSGLFYHFSNYLKGDVEIGLTAVKQKSSLFIQLSKELKDNKDLCLVVLEKQPDLIQYCGEAIKKDKKFGLLVVKHDPDLVRYLDDTLTNDEDICFAVVFKRPATVRYFGEKIKKDIKLGLIVVRMNGCLLKELDDELKNNLKICQAAMKNNVKSMAYFGSTITTDREMALQMIKLDSSSIQYLSTELKNDFDICLEVVQENASNFQYCGNEMKKNRQLILLAIRNSLTAVLHLDKKFLNDVEICKEIVKNSLAFVYRFGEDVKNDAELALEILEKDPSKIENLGPKIKSDSKLGLMVVKKNGKLIQHLDEGLKNDEEICKAAYKQTPFSFQHFGPKMQDNAEIGLKVLQDFPFLAEYFGPNLKKEKKLCLIAVKNDHSLIKYFDESLKEDFEVAEILNNKKLIIN